MSSGSQARVRRVATLGLLAGYATALNLLEAPLPRLVPWAKPGLANSAALLALMIYGLPQALGVAVVRVVLSGLLLGHLLTPGWWMGAAGALGAPLAMALCLRGSPPLGLLSVSAVGAVTSNALQLVVASLVLVESRGLLVALPWMVATALPAGALVAWMTHAAAARLPGWITRPEAAPGALP